MATQTHLDGALDVEAFTAGARRLARSLKAPAPDGWLPLYQRGLIAAQVQGDRRALADVAHFGAIRLDTDGHHAEAIAQLEFARSLCGADPSAVALLRSMQGLYEALAGNGVAAQVSVAAAEAAALRARPQRIRLECAVNCAIARCILLLELDSLDDVEALAGRVHRTKFEWQSSGLVSWLIPTMVARGGHVSASQWVRALAALAESGGHPWRAADAAAFRYALDTTDAGRELEAPTAGANYLAAWRIGLARLQRAVRSGGSALHADAGDELQALRTRVHAGFADGFHIVQALLAGGDVHGGQELDLAPPRGVSLLNIGLVLAGAELVAVHGTQSTATTWISWFGRSVSPAVRTALEWPVARDRVEGLLRIRTGDVRGGTAQLRAAIRWCDESGYDVEAGIARLQLAEVLALGEVPAVERRWRRLRATGLATIQQHGLDPVVFAYDATRALAQGRGARTSLLAPREVEVLRLLAEGMTYREAASVLGVQWRTVQTHAYHAYSKLGVGRRVAAVDAARRLGVI